MVLAPPIYRQTAEEILRPQLPGNPVRLQKLILTLAAALDVPGQNLFPFAAPPLIPSQNEIIRQLLTGKLVNLPETQRHLTIIEKKIGRIGRSTDQEARVIVPHQSTQASLIRDIQQDVYTDLKVRERIIGNQPRSVPASSRELPTDINALSNALKPLQQLRDIFGTTRLPKDADDLPEDVPTLKTMALSLLTVLRGKAGQIQQIRDKMPQLKLDTAQAAVLSSLLRHSEMSLEGLRISGSPSGKNSRSLGLGHLSLALKNCEGITLYRSPAQNLALQPQSRYHLLSFIAT